LACQEILDAAGDLVAEIGASKRSDMRKIFDIYFDILIKLPIACQ
jgi:hypothetical protein